MPNYTHFCFSTTLLQTLIYNDYLYDWLTNRMDNGSNCGPLFC